MKLAILSDIHDNVWNLRAVLERIADTDAVLCCGDLCAPFMVARLAEGASPRPVHVVFGNNDGDLYRITSVASGFENVTLHGELYRGEIDGVRIVMTHYDTVAATITPEGTDLVCYGHNHAAAIDERGGCCYLNPGAIMGYTPAGNRDIPVTFAVYDTSTRGAVLHTIGTGNRIP